MPLHPKDAAKIRAREDITHDFDIGHFEADLMGTVLTLDTMEEIDNLKTTYEKNKRFLEILIESDSSSYEVFLKLLKDHGFHTAVEKLESGLPEATVNSGQEEKGAAKIEVPPAKRELRPNQKQLMHLSSTVLITHMPRLATFLDISKNELAVIQMGHQDPSTQMMHLLLKWHAKNGLKATLGNLMDKFNVALEEGVDIDVAKVNNIIDKV